MSSLGLEVVLCCKFCIGIFENLYCVVFFICIGLCNICIFSFCVRVYVIGNKYVFI